MTHPPNEAHIDDDMMKVEVNLDDISGEILGFLMDRLIEAGANDVYYTPIYMKKNRPGVLLQLLCATKTLPQMKEILFTETTTLGVRYYPLTVHRAERRFTEVETKWGKITMKEGIHQGKVIQTAPEYEECRLIAVEYGVPLQEVYKEAWKQWDKS